MYLPPKIEGELVWYLTEFEGACGLKSLAFDAAPAAGNDAPPAFGAVVKAGPPRRALAALSIDERAALVGYYSFNARATPAARRAAGPLGRMAAVMVLTPAYRGRRDASPVCEAVARVQRDAGGLDLCRLQANKLLRRACRSYCVALGAS